MREKQSASLDCSAVLRRVLMPELTETPTGADVCAGVHQYEIRRWCAQSVRYLTGFMIVTHDVNPVAAAEFLGVLEASGLRVSVDAEEAGS